jgi:hypothetical protein
MIRKFYQYSVLIFALASCTITTSTDDDITPDGPVISDQVAQGKASTPDAFVLKTAFYRNETLFGKEGYRFSLYDKNADCTSGFAPISFFITKLDKGATQGQGPYFYYYVDAKNFGTTSFMGCDVIITNVTATTVEGKVKGGNTTTNQYIEGKFTATLCK